MLKLIKDLIHKHINNGAGANPNLFIFFKVESQNQSWPSHITQEVAHLCVLQQLVMRAESLTDWKPLAECRYAALQTLSKKKNRCEDMMLLLLQLSGWKAWQKPADACSPWCHDPIWSGVYCACCGERAGTALELMSHTLLWTEEEKPDVTFEQKEPMHCLDLYTPMRRCSIPC